MLLNMNTHIHTSHQCENKWKSLKNPSRTRRSCPYERELSCILPGRASIVPPLVLSARTVQGKGTILNELTVDCRESDSGCTPLGSEENSTLNSPSHSEHSTTLSIKSRGEAKSRSATIKELIKLREFIEKRTLEKKLTVDCEIPNIYDSSSTLNKNTDLYLDIVKQQPLEKENDKNSQSNQWNLDINKNIGEVLLVMTDPTVPLPQTQIASCSSTPLKEKNIFQQKQIEVEKKRKSTHDFSDEKEELKIKIMKIHLETEQLERNLLLIKNEKKNLELRKQKLEFKIFLKENNIRE
ncbi:hypothetical protein RN001_005965 [Aquatica leii]|uniref:Uncharacterized protein n=1 Tax=Aquatica leii TaxID=1421715 RepID=A0AAN7SAY4_9COLE|nr:hypothetical protein RN001_005965 [Aquatica leii]